MDKPRFTVSEVAEHLGVHRDTIYRWERSGKIKSRRDRNNYRVYSKEAIEKLKRWVVGIKK